MAPRRWSAWSSALASDVAGGVWSATAVESDEVRVTLTTRRGQPLPQPGVFTVAFAAGFPERLRSERGAGWPDVEQLGFTLGSGDTHPLVCVLQAHLSALARIGAVTIPAVPEADGSLGGTLFDEATRRAVAAFQVDQRLVPTGAVDLVTWRVLTGASMLRQTRYVPGPLAPLALPATTAQGASVVYLTFDDGPNPPFTQQVLEVLARYGARATFFAVGQQVRSLPAQIRAEASSGHYVANHTFDHHTLEGLSRQRFADEAQQTRSLILGAAADLFGLDKDVRYLRPPYGATDADTQGFAAALGSTLVLWDVDPQDWRRPGAGQIARHVLSHVHSGARRRAGPTPGRAAASQRGWRSVQCSRPRGPLWDGRTMAVYVAKGSRVARMNPLSPLNGRLVTAGRSPRRRQTVLCYADQPQGVRVCARNRTWRPARAWSSPAAARQRSRVGEQSWPGRDVAGPRLVAPCWERPARARP